MRKKVLLLAGCVLASVFMLTGCGESYPKISVYRSEWGENNLTYCATSNRLCENL